MAIYVFQSVDGEQIDRVYPMEKAPTIGSLLILDGKEYRRIPSFLIGTGTIAQHGKYPYLSSALPTTVKGCKMASKRPGGRKKPLIESQKHERDMMARYDLVKD